MQISRTSVLILIYYLWIYQIHGQFIDEREEFEMQQKKADLTARTQYFGTDKGSQNEFYFHDFLHELTDVKENNMDPLQYESRKENGLELWSNGLVPVVMSNQMATQNSQDVMAVVRHIEEVSCVKFLFYPSIDALKQARISDYIILKQHDEPGCQISDQSFIPCGHLGRRGGPQQVAVWGRASHRLYVLWTLARALGMHFEHQRSDRDKYILVNPKVIHYWWIQKVVHNDYGVPYNLKSTLHTSCGYYLLPWSWVNRNQGLLSSASKPDPLYHLCNTGTGWKLGFGDAEKLRRMYNCDSKKTVEFFES